MNAIVLDTEQGGYLCWACGLPLAADEPQLVFGGGRSLYVVCDDCCKNSEAVAELLP